MDSGNANGNGGMTEEARTPERRQTSNCCRRKLRRRQQTTRGAPGCQGSSTLRLHRARRPPEGRGGELCPGMVSAAAVGFFIFEELAIVWLYSPFCSVYILEKIRQISVALISTTYICKQPIQATLQIARKTTSFSLLLLTKS